MQLSTKRVLILIPTLGLSGGNQKIIDIAEELSNNGMHVTLLYPMLIPNVNGWRYLSFIDFAKYITWFFLNFFNYVPKEYNERGFTLLKCFSLNKIPQDYDIYMATWWETAHCLFRSQVSKKAKKIYFIQGYEIWNGQESSVVETYAYQWDLIITISQYLKNKITRNSKREPLLLYNSISHIFLDSKLKLGFLNYKIGVIIRSGKNKGFRIFEKVVRERSLDINYLSKHNYFNKPNHFDGQVKEGVLNFYQSLDLLIIPSFEEGFSLPALEASMNGTLVAMKMIGIASEIIVDDRFILSEINENSINKVIDYFYALSSDEILQLKLETVKKARHFYEAAMDSNQETLSFLTKI